MFDSHKLEWSMKVHTLISMIYNRGFSQVIIVTSVVSEKMVYSINGYQGNN